MLRDNVKKLIHDKVFLVSIGISIVFWLAISFLAGYGDFNEISRLAMIIWFAVYIGYSYSIGKLLELDNKDLLGHYTNLALMYFFIILFWSLIIYSILKIFLKLFEEVRGK